MLYKRAGQAFDEKFETGPNYVHRIIGRNCGNVPGGWACPSMRPDDHDNDSTEPLG